MKTLESYIAEVLETYLREDVQGEFEINHLRNMKELPQIIGYVERTLGHSRIGEGQGRTVYRLQNGTVLKVAKNLGGISQNEAEATVCKSEETSDIFPRIFELGPNATWLIAEEAKGMTRVKFSTLTGIPWNEFQFAIGGSFPNSLDVSHQTANLLKQYQDAFNKHYANPFLRRVINLIKDCKYEPGDIVKLDSWGVVRNKPVIIDSGFTETVNKTHYRK